MRNARIRLFSILLLALGLAAGAAAQIPGQEAPTRRPDVIYVPTPQEVVEAMLDVAKVGANDLVYDLGCGDGRIVVTAAKKYGARGVGIDIDPVRIKEANENVASNGVGDKVEIRQADLFETDLSQANVVTLYLLSSLDVNGRTVYFWTITEDLKKKQ